MKVVCLLSALLLQVLTTDGKCFRQKVCCITLIIALSNTAIVLSRYNYASTSYYYGTVRIYYNGWGNICYDNYYSYNDANVICHQLGYTGVSTYSRAGLVR